MFLVEREISVHSTELCVRRKDAGRPSVPVITLGTPAFADSPGNELTRVTFGFFFSGPRSRFQQILSLSLNTSDTSPEPVYT